MTGLAWFICGSFCAALLWSCRRYDRVANELEQLRASHQALLRDYVKMETQERQWWELPTTEHRPRWRG